MVFLMPAHSFNKYLLCAYYVVDIALCSGDTEMKKKSLSRTVFYPVGEIIHFYKRASSLIMLVTECVVLIRNNTNNTKGK